MAETNYLWDEIEDNVIEEYDDLGNTNVSYTTGPTQYGPVLSQDRGGEVRNYHFDGLGNTTELSDSNASVTDTRRYSAFGEVTASTGTTDFPYQWGGKFGNSSNSARYFIRHRVVTSISGRWLSLDPLGIAEADSPNLYLFVLNSPLTWSDPSGLLCSEDDDDKAKCCCCAGDVQIKKGNRPPVSPMQYPIDIDITTNWVSNTTNGECDFEWYEWSSHDKDLGAGMVCKAHKWCRVDNIGSPSTQNWTNRQPITECDKKGKPRKTTLPDDPGFPAGTQLKPDVAEDYTLYFAFKLTSAKDCPCNPTTKYIWYRFKLKVINGQIDGKPTIVRNKAPKRLPNDDHPDWPGWPDR